MCCEAGQTLTMTALETGMNGTKGGNGTNGWSEYRRLVLKQLEDNSTAVGKLGKSLVASERASEERGAEIRLELQEVKSLLTTDQGESVTALAQRNGKRLDKVEWRSSALGVLGGSVPMIVAAVVWWLTRS